MRCKKTRLIFLVLVLVSAASMSCGKQEPAWKGRIFREAVFELREDLVLGRRERDKEFKFIYVAGLGIDEEGNIYVLDSKAAEVKVFDANGRFLRVIGSPGQGPGEFQYPRFIQIFEERRELFIMDPHAQRFLYFSLEGDYLRQVSTARSVGGVLSPIKWDDAGHLTAFIILPPPEGRELVKFNADMDRLMVIAKQGINEHSSRWEYQAASPGLHGAVFRDGRVIWGNSATYELTIINPEGKIVGKITRAVRPVRIGEDWKKRAEERFQRLSVGKSGFKLVFPKHFPFFHRISVDDQGRIFVLTYETAGGPGDHGSCDVFDPDGRYMGKAPWPIRALEVYWTKDKLYTIELDEDDYHCVKRYKISWNY